MKIKVITVSRNRNSFGLRGTVFFAEDGTAYEGAANDLNLRLPGTVLNVKKGTPVTEWLSLRGYEIPRQLPNPPKEAFDAAFAADGVEPE